MKYWMSVCLVMEDVVEADSPEEAFEILSDSAISGGDWSYSYKRIDDAESEE